MWLRSLGVFAVGESMPPAQRGVAGVLAAILALSGAFRLARSVSGRRPLWLLVPYLLAPLMITWGGAVTRPIFNERYIIAALPAFLLLIAGLVAQDTVDPQEARGSGTTSLARTGEHRPTAADAPLAYAAAPRWSSWPALALGIILLAATVQSLVHHYDDPTYSKSRGWRQLAAVMTRYSRSWPADRVRVAQTYPDPTLWYYFTSSQDCTECGVRRVVLPPAAKDEAGARVLVNTLAAQDVQRVVVAVQPSEGWDDREIAPRALQEAYRLVGETPVGDWRVQVYERPPSDLPALMTSFANGLQLTGAAVPGEQVSPGDVLPVYLQWQSGQQSLSGSEKITVQLLDSRNKVAAQLDQPFGPADLEAAPATYALNLARTLPAGSYRLIVALYDPSREGSPRIPTLEGNDHVVLGVLASH
jgi:hypothetical protein